MKIVNKLYLTLAGVSLRLNFYWTKDELGSSNLKQEIKRNWGKFISKHKKVDFEINFKDFPLKIYTSKNEQYFLGTNRKSSLRNIDVHYFTSVKILDVIFREIVNNVIERDGFILHSSAVVGSDKVLRLFLAKSGGGKSTTANNLKMKFKKVADDSVVIRRFNNKWIVYPSPFVEKQEYPINKSYSKLVVYRVVKSNNCSVRPIENSFEKVRLITGALWLNYAVVSSSKLNNILMFCNDTKFYTLNASLDKKRLQKVLNEIQN